MSAARNRPAAATSNHSWRRHKSAANPNSAVPAVDADFSQHWGHTTDWLESLKRLVEEDVAFSAQKFTNYLEAEIQLFHRMPELQAICQEARRLCRANPRVSSQVAARVGHIQSTWLAIENRLAEFKSQRSLLAALSLDLKQLESCHEGSSRPLNIDQEGHICCTTRIEFLDGTVQRREDQLQQIRSVTSAVSRLLDWLCCSDTLLKSTWEMRYTQVPHDNNAAARSSAVVDQSSWLSGSSTGSTTYQPSQSNTDGDLPDPQSSDSSEIIAQSGTRNQNQNDSHDVTQATQEITLSRDPVQDFGSEDTSGWIASGGEVVKLERAAADQPETEGPTLSPLLQTVNDRIAALTYHTHVVHTSLHTESFSSSNTETDDPHNNLESQLSQLSTTEAALSTWQTELLGLRACVLAAAAVADPPEEAIFRRTYLESIELLTNWTGSLRDRCKSHQLTLRHS